MGWYGFKPYVSVEEQQRRAKREVAALRKKGKRIEPVEITGRAIARTFWGKAWCEHLESFHDFSNRLPRGRRYVRNGSVCHLAISKGSIEAKVAGSELYDVQIMVKTLSPAKWRAIKQQCSGKVGSLLELLAGNLSDNVMEVVTDRKNGLFPLSGEISLNCDCPDWAIMCKHVSAVLYGVGARLDSQPELLFKLRGVDHEELITADAEAAVTNATTRSKSKQIANSELAAIFGIDIQTGPNASPTPTTTKPRKQKNTSPKASRKKTATQASKKTPKRKVPVTPPSSETFTGEHADIKAAVAQIASETGLKRVAPKNASATKMLKSLIQKTLANPQASKAAKKFHPPKRRDRNTIDALRLVRAILKKAVQEAEV